MLTDTHMHREVLDIPQTVATLLQDGKPAMVRAAKALADRDPSFMISVARGSSDHAATYFKYASELLMGVPVASVGPSVASVYQRPLKLGQTACLAVSQSGKSPDIVSLADMATTQGALSFALTNHSDSDLARVCNHTLNLHAGTEISVAATKTFVTSVVSAIWLLAEWRQDQELLTAIRNLPDVLERAIHQDWSPLANTVANASSIYCLGRGPGLAISHEAALKFKETCQLHAESYSSAEVMHGPVSIVQEGFPVIGFTSSDQAEQSLTDVATQIAAKGADVFVTSPNIAGTQHLPTARTGHPLTDPISLIVSFYAMVGHVALARGMNPDTPRHLNKVTETV